MALLGHIRGGLGYVVIASAMLLASLSGSAIADTAALSVLLLPLMASHVTFLSHTGLAKYL